MGKPGHTPLVVGVIAVIVYAFAIYHAEERYMPGWSADGKGVRIVQDFFDRGAYFVRGSWYVVGMEKINQLSVEYPPLAAYVFAIPFAAADMMGKSGLINPRLVLNLMSAMMALGFIGLLAATRSLVRETNGDERLLYLFVLPGFLYFSLNRYDVLPSLLATLAILFAIRGKPLASGVAIGVGAMLKWYPILLAPIIFAHMIRSDKPKAAKLVAGGVLAVALLSLPMLVVGGWDAILDPYRFQSGRGGDALSVFGLIAAWFGSNDMPKLAKIVLLTLQLAIPLVALVNPPRDRESLLDWALLSVLAFVFFAKFYSPQWIIWIVPIAIARHIDKKTVALLVALDILSYLLFPILYDVFAMRENSPGALFSAVVIVKTAVLVALAIDPAKRVVASFRSVPDAIAG